MDTSLDKDTECNIKLSTEYCLLVETLEAIQKISKDLSNKIEKNTHRDIKELAIHFKRQADVLGSKKIVGWLKNFKHENTNKDSKKWKLKRNSAAQKINILRQ